MIRSVAVLDERRGDGELGSVDDVGMNKGTVGREFKAEMCGSFEALIDGERVEMLMEPSDDCPYCFLGSMGREADLGNMDSCVIDEAASERRGRAKIEFGV